MYGLHSHIFINRRFWGARTALSFYYETDRESHKRGIGEARAQHWLVCRKLSCDRSNVYRLFQKESIDTNLLTRISILLGKDFFSELSDNVKEKL
ncbi:MAG: hypothetical protein LUE99_16640 [Bacteroides sp.]|nr:hypothetical protein [Bacteroides sp.]